MTYNPRHDADNLVQYLDPEYVPVQSEAQLARDAAFRLAQHVRVFADPSAPAWIAVTPETKIDKGPVYFFVPNSWLVKAPIVMDGWYTGGENGHFESFDDLDIEYDREAVTHYMPRKIEPLPAPPESPAR